MVVVGLLVLEWSENAVLSRFLLLTPATGLRGMTGRVEKNGPLLLSPWSCEGAVRDAFQAAEQVGWDGITRCVPYRVWIHKFRQDEERNQGAGAGPRTLVV